MFEIIVPHYREPWSVGKKFFDMLNLQRGVDFSAFRVLVVNDGEENALPDSCFADCPYTVRQISIPHAGVSAARNAGIKESDAEWIMFCDFDDMFSTVYAMRYICDVLPADQFDMIWSDIIIEDKGVRMREDQDYTLRFYPYGQNTFFIHGKLYRREFLVKNNLFFDTSINYSEDTLFSRTLEAIIDNTRVGNLQTPSPYYIWTYSDNSVTTKPGEHYEWYLQIFNSNKKVCEVFKASLPYERYCAMVYKTVWEAYYALNIIDPVPDALRTLKDEFKVFWKEHKHDFEQTAKEVSEKIDSIQEGQSYYANFGNGKDKVKVSNKYTLLNWLREIDDEIAAQK